MNYDIDILLKKFEQGRCNADEEAFVEQFLKAAEQNMNPEYQAFVEKEREISTSLDLDDVLSASSSKISTNGLLKKFHDGTCSSDEQLAVNKIIEESERELPDVYRELIMEQREISYDLDVMSLIENTAAKNIDAELVESLLKEQEITHSSLYSEFLISEKQRTCRIDVAELIRNYEQEKEAEAKVVPMGQSSNRWKSLVGMAAVLVTVLSAILLLRPSAIENNTPLAIVNGVEIYDSEKALEYTLAALGTTSSKLKQGTDNMSLLKELRHTSIYK